MGQINPYDDLNRSKKYVMEGRHRECVGGLWDKLGQLPMEFLLDRGLSRDDKVIDIGCGCLRVGVHLIAYLESGNYFGTDISEDLLKAGYEVELKNAGLIDKQPIKNLSCGADFTFKQFGEQFDVAIAQSLFTHLPLNHLKLCLYNLYESMASDACFYATFFLASDLNEWAASLPHSPGGIVTNPCSDPYHYTIEDLESVASTLGWEATLIGDWGHPRDQKMVVFHKADRKTGGLATEFRT